MEDAGPRTEPPVYVPTSWALTPAPGEAVAFAVRACREAEALAAGKLRFGLVTAICQVAEERIEAGDDEAALLLSVTARILDSAAQKVVGDDVEAVLLGSACRRAAEACRTALVSLFLEGY